MSSTTRGRRRHYNNNGRQELTAVGLFLAFAIVATGAAQAAPTFDTASSRLVISPTRHVLAPAVRHGHFRVVNRADVALRYTITTGALHPAFDKGFLDVSASMIVSPHTALLQPGAVQVLRFMSTVAYSGSPEKARIVISSRPAKPAMIARSHTGRGGSSTSITLTISFSIPVTWEPIKDATR